MDSAIAQKGVKEMLKKKAVILCMLVAMVAVYGMAGADGPEVMVYSGSIPQGANQGDGIYDITFSIYAAEEGGSALWSETQSVFVYQGTFAVYLGAVQKLNVPFVAPYWVGVRLGDKEDIWPLTGAGYPVADNGGTKTKESAAGTPLAVVADEVLSANIKEADNVTAQNTNAGSGVKTGHIQNAAVTNAKLANNAVGNLKIANNAVTSAKIADGTIATADIANGAVTDPKITGPIATAKLNVGTAAGTVAAGNHAHNYDGNYVNVTGDTMTGPLTLNTGTISTSTFTGLGLQYDGPSGEGAIMSSYNDGFGYLSFYTKSGGGSPITKRMVIDRHGNVGIGTPSPAANLHLYTGTFLLGTSSAKQLRLRDTGSALDIESLGAPLFINNGATQNVYLLGAKVGIGTITPSQKLDVAGNARVVSSGKGLAAPAVAIENTDTTAGEPGGIAIWAKNHSGDATIVTQNTGAGDVFRAFNTAGTGFIFKVTGTGRVVTSAVQITGGGDLAERFEIRKPKTDMELQPGMVVSIDPENPGKLAVSRKAYDKTVAGIISGAGGINSGMVMGQEGSIVDGTQSVALTGRVYVMADASKKAIKPGDLLTTSDKAGHAMKVSNHTKSQGAIIGKAMTGLDKGTGLVLVLVSLQ